MIYNKITNLLLEEQKFIKEDDDYVLTIGRQSFMVTLEHENDHILFYESDIGMGYHELILIEYIEHLIDIIKLLTIENYEKAELG